MTDLENQILATLRELDDAARSLRAANPKPDLRPLLTRLDELASRQAADGDPELSHFLRRQSYEKALRWLEGRESEGVRGGGGQ